MVEIILNQWLNDRYKALRDAFGISPFSFSEAVVVINEKFGDDESLVDAALSQLWKQGWLRINEENENSEKNYRMISICEVLARLSKVDPKIGR